MHGDSSQGARGQGASRVQMAGDGIQTDRYGMNLLLSRSKREQGSNARVRPGLVPNRFKFEFKLNS